MVVIVIVVDGYTNILIIIIISGAGLTWVPNWTSGRKRSMLSKTSPLPCQIRWKPSQRTVTIAASQQAVVLGYCSLPTCTGRSVIQSSGHSSLCTLQHRLPIDSVVQHMSSPRVRYIQSCKIWWAKGFRLKARLRSSTDATAVNQLSSCCQWSIKCNKPAGTILCINSVLGQGNTQHCTFSTRASGPCWVDKCVWSITPCWKCVLQQNSISVNGFQ